MSKEYYTAGEIIMGTRREYLKIEDDLLRLRSMVCCDDIQVDDIYFEVLKSFNNKPPEIVCKFIQNPKTLRALDLYLKEKKGQKISEIEKGLLVMKNGRYEISNPFYIASIINGNEDEFSLIIKNILSSAFTNNITLYDLHNVKEPGTHMTMTTTGSIVSHYNSDDYYRIIYSSRNDYIIADSNKNIDDEILYKLFNFKVSADSLPTYHKEIINNNSLDLKAIELYPMKKNTVNKKFGLLIDECDDRITLTKTKIRRR